MDENTQETIEDALQRIAQQCQDAETKLEKYKEAIELWDNLDLEENQFVAEVLVIAKVIQIEADKTLPILAIATNDLDWIQQHGLVSAYQQVVASEPPNRADDEE